MMLNIFLICLFAICICSFFPFVEHFIEISLFHTHARKKTLFLSDVILFFSISYGGMSFENLPSRITVISGKL